MKNFLTKMVLLIFFFPSILIGQETGGPFQIELKVHRKNLNRIDQFNGEIDFNKPGVFKITIYDRNSSRDLDIFKLNMFEAPIGLLHNKQDYPSLIPFRKYFLFQIEPLKYEEESNKITIKIDYIIDEMIQSQSHEEKQTIKRLFKSVEKKISLGQLLSLDEINSVDPSQQVSLNLFNQQVKPPWQTRTEKVAKYIPQKLRGIDNYDLPPIMWRILHLVTDLKIEQKYWLDEIVAFPLLNKNQKVNFSFASLTSKSGYLKAGDQLEWSQRFVTIFIPRKMKGKKIDFTFLLLEGDPDVNEPAKLLFQKDLKIKTNEPLEIEVELAKSLSYRFFFYITAYLQEDLKGMYGKHSDR